ncbi:MAG TPA: hypothetical protein VKT77_04005 [Chthonomonadaceae bacterium]|nr:hypothetical protein [Chthonomonadaceae bacterium]
MNNPLAAYRRTQRELRRSFDAFTRENCAECPTPCCRQPARILPTDILLAEASGWRAAVESTGCAARDEAADIAGSVVAALGDPPAEGDVSLPCQYLGAAGCTFPADLRPFGCTTYICRYMYERLDRPTLTRLKRLVRELETQHRVLLRALHGADRGRKTD